MGWDEWWTEHLAKRGQSPRPIDEFWRTFIGEVINLVGSRVADGLGYGTDYRKAELVEAYANHGAYTSMELDRASGGVNVVYAVQRPGEGAYGEFFRVRIDIRDLLSDMGDFAVRSPRSALEAAAIVLNRLEIVSEGIGNVPYIAGQNS